MSDIYRCSYSCWKNPVRIIVNLTQRMLYIEWNFQCSMGYIRNFIKFLSSSDAVLSNFIGNLPELFSLYSAFLSIL